MMIAIYGIQRSGKTTLVDTLLSSKDLGDVVHIKPSSKMFEIMRNEYGNDSRPELLTKDQAGKVVSLFIDYVRNVSHHHKYVICDCHFGYIKDDHLYEIHPTFINEFFDLYFYMDTDEKVVLKRMKLTNGEKCVYDYTASDIKKWKEYEIKALTKILKPLKKELHMLTDNPYSQFLKYIRSSNV